MTALDYAIIFGYLATMLAIGLLHQKKASVNVRSYFLGGNKIPRWITAMSSSMSSIDITGTMLNVSILYFMGVRSFYYNIWVVGMVALMCHLGRWIRRSNVVTAADPPRGGRALARTPQRKDVGSRPVELRGGGRLPVLYECNAAVFHASRLVDVLEAVYRLPADRGSPLPYLVQDFAQ